MKESTQQRHNQYNYVYFFSQWYCLKCQ